MNIIFYLHLYPPVHNSGAEYYAHWVAKRLQKEGHHVRVLLRPDKNIPMSWVHDGIEVFQLGSNIEPAMMWGHAYFTHLDMTRNCAIMGLKLNRPVFWMCHNTFPYTDPDLFENFHILYNNEATKEICGYKNNSFTLVPPVDHRHYDVGKDPSGNEYITLINLNENKGGKFLQQLAQRLPKKKFLGVEGSYEEQYMRQPPNVTVWGQQTDIRKAYAVTRLLIVPSEYESWSMCATEAMCNGIPVVASDTFGLKLNVGKAGVLVKERNVEEWAKAIEAFDDAKTYAKYSKLAKKRSRELDPVPVLDRFIGWFNGVAGAIY